MQGYRDGGIAYSEMFQDEDGMFRAGEALIFTEGSSQILLPKDESSPFQEAADAWADWMRSQGHEVLELPRTMRKREWGLAFSVTARGEESRIFVVGREQ